MSALEEIPMEKNDFLLYNEIIYHIHTCQDMDDLQPFPFGLPCFPDNCQ